ncbi:LLM class flavin-dependent oxidoreductase [Planotetraspora sp. GP83]|uniref:LLM class flavin-dependent oxidoreductase n=1 Tax=Planotetraspora sp. GP83 TaxID=3156264 RepID=UPI003513601C
MSLHLYWFLPSHGDGRDLAERRGGPRSTTITRRKPTLGYLGQVARAADQLGFEGVLTPAGLFCEDAWVVASALAAQTDRLKFMIAIRPGLVAPLLAAQMAATFQRISGDRLQFNVVIGGDPDEQHRFGDWLDHDARYDRAGEFLRILSGVWDGKPYTFEGVHYQVRDALLTRPPAVPPTVFLGGSSGAARQAAAEHAEVYLTWGESPGGLAGMFKQARQEAEEHGRALSCGTRLHVITRETADEAWAEADRLIAGLDAETIAAAQRRFAASESEGQRRMAALHGGGLEIYPNVWTGYGLARPGPAAALVGSHAEVADRIAEFHAAGANHLILSAQPHLEEAYTFAEGVMPILRARGLL